MSNEYKRTKLQNNVRQLGSAQNVAGNQGQILSALDVLGAKLVRSESERETMRKLLNEALEAQDRLETQIERSQIHIERRLDQMEDKEQTLSEEDKEFINTQKQEISAAKENLQDNVKRQLKVEDKMRDAQQTIQKLQRRLDAADQKRTKLQRRIERVENIAADAQNALEAKAVVLLTDQSEQVRELQQLQAVQTQAAMRAIDNLHEKQAALTVNDDYKQGWGAKIKSSLGQNGSVLAILVALGLGWAMASSVNEGEPTYMMTADGEVIRLMTNDDIAPIATAQIQGQDTIEDDLAAFSTDWVTESILDEALADSEGERTETAEGTQEFDVLQTVESNMITMDKDLSLPDTIKELEARAFDGVAEAQHDLAALYTSGQADVSQNYERAGFWFRLAAEKGIANASYNLGVLYQQGLGQEQDLQQALDWYRRAAMANHPEAQYNLGISYIEGVGTRYNPSMAAAFFEKAAFSGIVEAAYNLGLILENGLLGEVRNDDAMVWYRAAAESGNLDALQALQSLAQRENEPMDAAGYLENGESLATYINPILGGIEPAAGGDNALFEDAVGDISLGTLIPTDEQILVAQIQEQLRRARLYNGPQDGIVGAGTVKSIRTYQRQNDLNIDGKATEGLFIYMLQQGTNGQG